MCRPSLLLAVLGFFNSKSVKGSSAISSCAVAKDDCQKSHNCAQHYFSVLLHCNSDHSSNMTCSENCIRALSRLENGSKLGYHFTHCDCSSTSSEDPEFCSSHNDQFYCRIQSQLTSESTTLPAALTVPCNTARRLCEENWLCREALHYYEEICEESFEEQSEASLTNSACVTERCQETYQILMRWSSASQLKGCTCNGNNDLARSQPNDVYCFTVGQLPVCTMKSHSTTLRTGASYEYRCIILAILYFLTLT